MSEGLIAALGAARMFQVSKTFMFFGFVNGIVLTIMSFSSLYVDFAAFNIAFMALTLLAVGLLLHLVLPIVTYSYAAGMLLGLLLSPLVALVKAEFAYAGALTLVLLAMLSVVYLSKRRILALQGMRM